MQHGMLVCELHGGADLSEQRQSIGDWRQALEPEIDQLRVQRVLIVQPLRQRPRLRAGSVPVNAQAAVGAGWRVSIDSNDAMRCRISRRSTIMSTAPCSSRNSLR